jgi:hypothetical protein
MIDLRLRYRHVTSIFTTSHYEERSEGEIFRPDREIAFTYHFALKPRDGKIYYLPDCRWTAA